MNLEELEEKSIDLASHFKGINNWIENNKDTDPNFYEMIDTLVEYGSLTAEYKNYYKENGYPTIHDSNGERKAESYDMPTLSTNLKKVQDEVYKMFRLRSKNSFFKDEVAKEFTSDLTVESTIGNYIIPEDKEIAEKKKQILRKVAGVYFYIWQVKQTNPNYQYDNVAEWEELQRNYKEYKEAVGNEIEKSYEGKILYSGPQFGGNIEKMFATIEKNYKYSEIKESNSEKEEVETIDELEEINKQAEALANRFKGINSWIEANKDTDPNFYEMIDCMVEYGKLAKLYDKYYQKTGYPTYEDGSEEKEATHYNLTLVSPKLKEAQSELAKMWSLRENSPFFTDETVRKFISELSMRTYIAEYNVPEDKETERLKKEILCKTAGIYFYIWQVKQTNPDYQYDNEEEWNNLLQAYEIYKDTVGVEVIYSTDKKEYEGPQFGRELEKMHAVINENYKYSDNFNKKQM